MIKRYYKMDIDKNTLYLEDCILEKQSLDKNARKIVD